MKLLLLVRRLQLHRFASSFKNTSAFQRVLFAFFAVGFLMLFVGDGKQHVVDLLGIVFVLSAYLYVRLHSKPVNTVPNYIHGFWVLYIGISIISTIFSISVGYSISTLVRVSLAYLLFVTVLEYSKHTDAKLFTNLLSVFTMLATGISFFLFLWPNLLTLPSMNLLYPTYGHSHLADLLLITLPISFYDLLHGRSRTSLILFLIVLAGFSITFARGALFIAGLYILFQAGLSWKHLKTPLRVALTVIGLMLVQSLLFFSFKTRLSNVPTNKTTVSRLASKPTLLSDGRKGFWQQAISGFLQSPIIGNGPGTYFLISKKYQNKPVAYSWFAHNFPLETLAELGASAGIVLVTFFVVFLAHSRRYLFSSYDKNQTDTAKIMLLHGVLLTSVYSLIEFNLNYLLVWMLFWSALGFLISKKSKMKIHQSNIVLKVTLLFLLYYYLSSMLVLLIPRDVRLRSKLSLYIAPYSVIEVKFILKDLPKEQTINNTEKSIIAFFHRYDPEILEAMAEYEENREENELSLSYYRELILHDSKNIENHKKYVSLLIRENKNEEILRWLQFLAINILPVESRPIIEEIRWPSNVNLISVKDEIINLFDETLPRELLFAKLYYKIGLSFIKDQPRITEGLWSTARSLFPNLSYFSVELAAFYFHSLQDTARASDALQYCMKNRYARNHCEQTLQIYMPIPGSLEKEIQNAPF